ncbi:MAG TPA: family 78 glycoside hydrolase catalytic domain [Verrucomicrobiae bacterium]|nr:family 78 glycoside hydrolase catalytic domain [Verrucomicrobiae bacterium]
MKNAVLILPAILSLTGIAFGQPYDLTDRWGRGAFIPEPSSTLDGVKPLAHWIWDSGAENPTNYYLLVRKTFTLEELPQDARAFISAYAYADVYINGRLLERCPMNCDPEYQCYDYFNIRPFLKTGSNCITAVVQNFGVGLHSRINARGGFFFQAKLKGAGAASLDLLSDDSWKVDHASAWNTQSRLRAPQPHLIGFIEEFDARLWPDGWQNPEFDDSTWEHAKEIGIPPVPPWNNLVVTERPRLTRTIVKPIQEWKAGDRMVYDFGTEIAGYPRFKLDAAAGGIQIEIGTGERLDSNRAPLVRTSGDHSDKYTTKQGLQSWQPYTWAGFRYFSIQTNPRIHILEVSAEYSHYTYEMGGSFECSDAQLNEFWKIGKHTLEINSIDTYEDPWREHTQYIAGDSRYMMIYGNYAFGKSSRFLSAYNLLCGAESQRWRADGAVRSRYPTDYLLQPGSSTYIPDYQLEWILMMREYFLYYGKDPLIESLYPNLKKAVDYFRQYLDPNTGLLANLPGWVVLDWPPTYRMEMKKIITGPNCLYVGALDAAADIADDFARDTNQAAIWRDQARQVKENINKELWSEKDRAYLDSFEGVKIGEQPQVYALVYGIPDESRKADLVNLIMKRGKASEEAFAYWVLNSMFTEGKDQWALDYLRANWGAQTRLAAFNGAWQEGWNLPWGSTSHAWSSGPTALLPQKVLGLEPTGYGWKTFAIIPHPGDLTWAKGTVATVAGNISVAWKKTIGGHFTLNLAVPEATKASVYLPSEHPGSIKINGKTLSATPGIKWRMADGKRVVLEISPGIYQIDCENGGN